MHEQNWNKHISCARGLMKAVSYICFSRLNAADTCPKNVNVNVDTHENTLIHTNK